NVDLIKGTGLSVHPDAKFYTGNTGQEQQVQIAVTPFYEEVFQVFPMCDGTATINMFFHTHPLMMRGNTGQVSPPSLGDVFAHSVLSNSRNFRQNRQLNTTMVMAFEGLYVYSILPHKFRQIMDRIDRLVAAYTGWTDGERELWTVGEAPGSVVNVIKMEIFDELREGHDRFTRDVADLVAAHRGMFDIRGAPVVADALWNCKGCVEPNLDFGFAKALGSSLLVRFCRENQFSETLRLHGFNYDFYPAPFDTDICVLAPVTARMVERDESLSADWNARVIQ
ncbi:MAG: hypothetical protein EBZ75_12035, partial [Oxalobacteraceae bacterium]|nr:hypothetical protein [Oxalobacteraceae bacterium]